MSGSPALPPPRFPWRAYVVALLAIVVFALWPLGSVVLTSLIANAAGCQVDEGSARACIIVGVDMGEALYAMGVLGWFSLVTLPLGAGAALVWLITLLIHRLAWPPRIGDGTNGMAQPQ